MRMIGKVAYWRFTAFPHDPRTAQLPPQNLMTAGITL